MTIAQARATLAPHNLVLRKIDGEYRVNIRGGREETAYYTDSLQDAVDTGLYMVRAVAIDAPIF